MARRHEYEELQRQVARLQADVGETHRRIDQTGDLLTTLVTSILTDSHGDNRSLQDEFRRLAGTVDEVKTLLAQERAEAHKVLAEVQKLRAEAAEDRSARAGAERLRPHCEPAPDPAPDPVPAPVPEAATPVAGPADTGTPSTDPRTLLELAADVAYVELSGHRDTWAFLVERAARGEHFRLPGDVEEDDDGTVQVEISGRTLIAVIDALWSTSNDPRESPGTRALAAQLYKRVGVALRDLEPADSAGQPVPRIVIDKRPAGSGPQPEPGPEPDGDAPQTTGD
ncbi:hypothetical protein [Streptomyces sp. URMC 129]|uniref:hypothetical protein n=1 Tax=Streptomyces sp. URMC 129 TaxID=3423407 RepID=UPI003F1CADAC